MEKSPENVTVDWYVDTAKERGKIASDGKLSLALGLTRPSVSFWRARRSWPNDQNMVAMAEIIGVDPKCALIDTQIWAAKDERVAATWRAIKKAIKAVPLFMLLALLNPAETRAFSAALAEPATGHSVYYVLRAMVRRFRFFGGPAHV